MKPFGISLLLCLLCVLCGKAALAQTAARYEISGSGAPTGSCVVTGSGYSQIYVDRTTGKRWSCVGALGTTSGTWTEASAAAGDIVGPASSTNNAVVLFNGTTGKLVKNSAVTFDGTTFDASTFVVKAAEFDSDTANRANNGTIRFAKSDFIGWRNETNTANILLSKDSSDRLAALSGFAGNLTGNVTGNINGTVGAITPTTGAFTALTASSSILDSGLTAGRVTYAGALGILQDDLDMTFSVDTLTVTKVVIGGGSALTSSGPGGALTALAFATPGTNVATALGVATGSLGAFTLNNLAQDNAFVGNTSGIATAKSIGSCSAGSSALTYNTTTHAFGCNSISGITNSAGANVVPKSNGTNLVASRISDNGTQILLDAGGVGNVEIDAFSAAIKVGVTADTIGFSGTIFNGSTFSSVDFGSGSSNATKIVLDDTAKTAVLRAETSISIDSGAGATTIGDVNSANDGLTIQVDDTNTTINLGLHGTSNNIQINPANKAIFSDGGFDWTIGKSSQPFASLYIGNAATNNIQLTGTATAPRVATFPDATGTVQLVGAANTGTILPVDMSNGVLSTATGTVYASPGTTAGLTNATESAVSFPVTRAGTIRNLYVRTGGTAKVNTPTTVITIRKNGVDTAVTLTMTQTTATTTSDTTHSFTVVAGDLITVSFVTTGAAGVSTSIAGVSFEVD